MLLLRKVRENRWYKSEAAPFLAQGDVPADSLGDCNTKEQRLSVYCVADDRSNIERIVRAIALGGGEISDTGFVVFDSGIVDAVGIGTDSRKPGNTLDDDVNKLHLDLTDLSGNRLVALVKGILETGESGTVLKKRLRELIEEGIRVGQLPEKCRAKLQK